MKRRSIWLVTFVLLSMVFATGIVSAQLTEVGTPRNETLIVETQTPTDVPGQFNSYMMGTTMGFGIHQLMSAMMWEMDTVSGQQYGEVADGFPSPTRTLPSISFAFVRALSGQTAKT